MWPDHRPRRAAPLGGVEALAVGVGALVAGARLDGRSGAVVEFAVGDDDVVVRPAGAAIAVVHHLHLEVVRECAGDAELELRHPPVVVGVGREDEPHGVGAAPEVRVLRVLNLAPVGVLLVGHNALGDAAGGQGAGVLGAGAVVAVHREPVRPGRRAVRRHAVALHRDDLHVVRRRGQVVAHAPLALQLLVRRARATHVLVLVHHELEALTRVEGVAAGLVDAEPLHPAGEVHAVRRIAEAVGEEVAAHEVGLVDHLRLGRPAVVEPPVEVALHELVVRDQIGAPRRHRPADGHVLRAQRVAVVDVRLTVGVGLVVQDVVEALAPALRAPAIVR